MANLQSLYKQIEETIVSSGKRIRKESGEIADIGVLKPYLTEEDIAIERTLTRIITTAFPDHVIFAEEEHADFQADQDVWVIDPISGTASFIAGIPHYGLVVTHARDGEPVFACVYDPSADELFTARRGQGAFLNDKQISVSDKKNKVLFNLTSTGVVNEQQVATIWHELIKYRPYRTANSFAVNYAWVACGRFDGIIAVSKDAFPEYAGWLLINEASGTFTNGKGENIAPTDRLFCGGNPGIHDELMAICSRSISA